MQRTVDDNSPDLTAMFQADFGETVQKICEAVTNVYGEGGAQMLTNAVDAAFRAQ